MISIAKVSNPKYHLEHSQFDYYSENENEKGEFRGALMKWQKLEHKEVDEKNYMKQVNFGGEENKGIDLCFSPPKDWTLLYNLVDDETRLKMEEIRDKAVNAVIKGIEQNTFYRETKDGETKYVLAKGVGMATFNHHTSREVQDEKINPGAYVDPQEHTHITVFPKVLGQDGKFHSNTLLDMKYEKDNNHESLRYLDQLGQYELCKGLQDLGFSVYEADKNGNFAIEGITDNIRDYFSKRKEQINNEVGEDASYKEKKEIALKFRATKSSNNLASLKETWKKEMEALGFDKDKINSMRTNKIMHEDKKLEDIIDKDKTLSNKKIKTLALSESKFTDKSYKEKLNEFSGDKKVRPISKKINIYANNKAKEKLCDRVDKKKSIKSKKTDKQKLEDKKNDKQQKEIKKNANKDMQRQKDEQMSAPQALKDSTSKIKNDFDNSEVKTPTPMPMQMPQGNSKQELISSIDELEMQLFSIKPDGKLDTDLKIGQIMEQIGQLKKQLNETEKQESQSIAQQQQKEQEEVTGKMSEVDKFKVNSPEEEEEKLIEKTAEKFSLLIDKEDSIKDNSATKQFEKAMEDFANDHGQIINNTIQQSQTTQIQTATQGVEQ